MRLPIISSDSIKEIVKGSAIATDIARANFWSARGNEGFQFVVDINKVSGKVHPDAQWRWLRARNWEHLASGWVFQGADPLNDGETMTWGCFKSNSPRTINGKVVKYEHPYKTDTRAFFPHVTWRVGYQIAVRCGLADEYLERAHAAYVKPHGFCVIDGIEDIPNRWLKRNIDKGFYDWVKSKIIIPIIITEGAKKAAALVSGGYVAIGLPGIWNGRRVDKDATTKTSYLIPEVQYFTQKGRTFIFCFDRDEKPSTLKAVRSAIWHTGKLLFDAGCQVIVLSWDLPHKGVDDLLVVKGITYFEELYQLAPTFAEWQWLIRKQNQLLTPVTVGLNVPDLSTIGLELPKTGIVGIISPKATGKTKLIASETRQLDELVSITHRIFLGRSLGGRLGYTWRTDADRGLGEWLDPETGEPTLKLGTCVESLLAIDANKFSEFDIVIDEAVQVIRSLLTSSTCNQDGRRPTLLARLTQLIRKARRVILADADLDDTTINYIKTLRGEDSCYLVKNDYKLPGYDVELFVSPDDSSIICHAVKLANEGKKLLIQTDSKLATKLLERMIKEGLKVPGNRILTINAETSGDEQAQSYIKFLESEYQNYDVVIASPSMCTGVSIEMHWFDEVIGVYYGVLNDGDIAQALARVREPIKRTVWVNQFGRNYSKVSHSTYPEIVKKDLFTKNDREIALIRPSLRPDLLTFVDYQYERDNDPHIKTFCKISAEHNYSMWALRDNFVARMKYEGNTITTKEIRTDADTKSALKELREDIEWDGFGEIAVAKPLDVNEKEDIKKSEQLTREQIIRQKKTEVMMFCKVVEDFNPLLGGAEQIASYCLFKKRNPIAAAMVLNQFEITPEVVEAVEKHGHQLTRYEDLQYGIEENSEAQGGRYALSIDRSERTIYKQASWGYIPYAPDLPTREQERYLLDKLGFSAYVDIFLGGVAFTEEDLEDLCSSIRTYHKDCNEVLKIGFSPTSKKWSNVRIFNRLLERLGIPVISERFGREQARVTRLDEEKWEVRERILQRRALHRELAKVLAQTEPAPEKVPLGEPTAIYLPASTGGIDVVIGDENLLNSPITTSIPADEVAPSVKGLGGETWTERDLADIFYWLKAAGMDKATALDILPLIKGLNLPQRIKRVVWGWLAPNEQANLRMWATG
ncbi:MAG: plasmid replication protein, CyRepA1 family (plasmid) [Phormidium sp.]